MPKQSSRPDAGRQLDLDHYFWRHTRREGIADLHALTAAAKELDAVAAAQHADENHFYYSTFINF
jgi:hypothetical protein